MNKEEAREDFVQWMAKSIVAFVEYRGERYSDRERLISRVEVECGIDLWEGYRHAYKFLFEAEDEELTNGSK